MDDQKIIEDLILNGAIEVSGIDIESGELLYNFTSKLKSFNPELHDEFSKYFSSETYALWEHGFIDMQFEDDETIVTLTSKAFDEEQVLKLEKNRQYTLKEIIRIIMSK